MHRFRFALPTLALVAAGIGPGDEVVVPAMTFVATAEAVLHAGAEPLLVDVDSETLLLSEEAVAAVRTRRTMAVLPVHLYGHAVPFDRIEAWQQSGLTVIEDAAQAHLAKWKGRTVGTVGAAAAFSFYPGKNLGALGDGGAVLSADLAHHEAVLRRRNHGSVDKYRHVNVGWCSRLDGVQAAWLRVKLRHLARWTEARRRLADRYRAQLPDGILVPWDEGAVHHLLVVRVPAERRAEIAAVLEGKQIGTGLHYPFGGTDVTPFAAVVTDSISAPAHTEATVSSTTAFAVQLEKQSFDRIRSELGIGISNVALDSAAGPLLLSGRIGWAHEFEGHDAIPMAFAAFPFG